MPTLTPRARKTLTDRAWFDLRQACQKSGDTDRLFDKLEAAALEAERDHRRFLSSISRRYRLTVSVAARAVALSHVARPVPSVDNWHEAATTRADVLFARAIRERIGALWSEDIAALADFDYAAEID